MDKSQIFAAVAEFYEYSMKNNCDYDLWAQFVLSEVNKRFRFGKGIDVACGSGHFTRALKKAGYDVSGTDISAEMLTAAEKESAAEKLFIPYFRADMTTLRINGKVDFITAINDAINCLPTDKLINAFKSFNKCLNKGGLLFFDISSGYRLQNVIGNNTFCEDDDDYSYIWFNHCFSDRVEMEMSVFMRDGDLFKKTESTLTEYIHNREDVEQALKECGFLLECVSGELGEKYNDKSERINFAAIKL